MKGKIPNTKTHHYKISENKKENTKVSRERRDYLKRNTTSRIMSNKYNE